MLHVNEYMLLMKCEVGEGMVVVCGLVSCTILFLLLKVTLTFVFLNKLVIFLTCVMNVWRWPILCLLWALWGGVVGRVFLYVVC